MSIRIAIFDENDNVRHRITELLNTDPAFQIVGNYKNAVSCVRDIYRLRPDIVIMDIEMAKVNSIETVRTLNHKFPHIQILIQTVFEDDERVFQSIAAGASGYILKTHLNRFLINAIKELYNGGSPMSPSISRKVINTLQKGLIGRIHPRVPEYKLTPRERQVLAAVVDGLSHKMIGMELNISYDTVRTHIKSIYEKLDVNSLTGVVAKAIHHNII
ncbi:response regulator transcription factor [Pedobacter sp. MC2016-15]|uniref:LuxR C-terminal-related transcriptional regulator n=1 Tax=Pedobacter sp. MC2016-15 TaxID=2994473 RepID=UPI002247BF40|nr:response regulator transcription factor [Pedobacter sp. MC2016-15]MCX2480254.1 response regulator transcription factor [Pedobacter sp. MC2016-15]